MKPSLACDPLYFGLSVFPSLVQQQPRELAAFLLLFCQCHVHSCPTMKLSFQLSFTLSFRNRRVWELGSPVVWLYCHSFTQAFQGGPASLVSEAWETPVLLNVKMRFYWCFNVTPSGYWEIPTGVNSVGPGRSSFGRSDEHRFQLCRGFLALILGGLLLLFL